MRTKIATMMVLFCAVIFSSCSKEEIKKKETLEINIESDGGKYSFASNNIEVEISPNEYYAEVNNNTIVGKYAGNTRATIISNNTTYKCYITVIPSFTYYVDMAIYLGFDRSEIEKMYGSPLRVKKSTCYYAPLLSSLPEEEVAFTYIDNKVTMCASYFSLFKMANVTKHLQQRYATYTIKDNIVLYGNAIDIEDCSMSILCNISGAAVIYMNSDAMSKSNDYNNKIFNHQSIEGMNYNLECR